jgi:hypothetical protein
VIFNTGQTVTFDSWNQTEPFEIYESDVRSGQVRSGASCRDGGGGSQKHRSYFAG